MVVDVCLPAVLRLGVPVWYVHVVQRGVVVLVCMVGLQVTPVLTPVQVVGDVEVLMPMLHRVVLVMPLRSRHAAHRLSHRTAEKPNVHPGDEAGETAGCQPRVAQGTRTRL